MPALPNPVRAVKAWRKRRVARIDEIAGRDELCQWWEGGGRGLPPVDRRAVPPRRKRKIVTS